MSDDRFLALSRRAWARQQAPGGPACLDDERLAELVLNEIVGPERHDLLDHVFGCRRCTASLRLLRELHAAAGELRPEVAAPRAEPAPRNARRTPWLVAALLAAGLGVTSLWYVAPEPTPVDGLRGPGEAAVLPIDGALLESLPDRLSWLGAEGDGPYRARLFDAEGEEVWRSSETREKSVALPVDLTGRLPPGAYFWVVESTGSPGAGRLGPFWIEVAPGR